MSEYDLFRLLVVVGLLVLTSGVGAIAMLWQRQAAQNALIRQLLEGSTGESPFEQALQESVSLERVPEPQLKAKPQPQVEVRSAEEDRLLQFINRRIAEPLHEPA